MGCDIEDVDTVVDHTQRQIQLIKTNGTLLVCKPVCLDHYRSWLNSLHIGLAPLLPTDYNRCRSDVKFLDYAAAGAVAMLQNEAPYQAGLRCNGFSEPF